MRPAHRAVQRKQIDYDRTMDADIDIAPIAGLVADPSRARMLVALMDGRARTAKELAYGAGVTPQTASSHLAKLLAARLLAVERQSRHRYYRLAGPAVGQTVEALMAVSPPRARAAAPRRATAGPLDRLRLARTCYDHLAGRLGVLLTRT
jgi:DNA-binding transcriptional ArsR family regulator